MGGEGIPKQEQTPEAAENKESLRDKRGWGRLYAEHLGYLRRVYPERTPDGEPVTEEWMDNEAEKMANAQYKMLQKQKILDSRKATEESFAETLSPEAIEALREQAENGSEYAQRVLDLFEKED